jgi:hypothetical protein
VHLLRTDLQAPNNSFDTEFQSCILEMCGGVVQDAAKVKPKPTPRILNFDSRDHLSILCKTIKLEHTY